MGWGVGRGWGVNLTVLFAILGSVVGGVLYLWLMTWGALRFGDFVMEATGSEGLGWGAYLSSAFFGLALPVAIGVALNV